MREMRLSKRAKIWLMVAIGLCLSCAVSFYCGFQIADSSAKDSNAIESSTDSKTLAEYDINTLRESYAKDSSEWEKPFVDSGIEWEEIGALPPTPPYPAENPYSEAKAKLGEKLFNDPLLSASNQIACASCHDKELGFSNGRSLAFGHNRQLGRRNSPSVVMSAFSKEQFWDGRAESLEAQVSMPIADPKEMAYSIDKVANKLNQIAEYRAAFAEVFGDSRVTSERIAQAIATYERSLMPKSSKFDRFMRENAKYRANSENKMSQMLNDKEILGLHLFRTKARCINCHFGVAFSDGKYHNLGFSFYGRAREDLGRYEVTRAPSDVGSFKTPSLRQVSKSAPYMHTGTFPNLSAVIAAYDFGMARPKPRTPEQKTDPLFPKTDKILKPLNLSDEEREALEAFLRTL